MMRWLMIVVAALLFAGSSVIAQSAQRPAADQKITVVGCVERADQILAREDLGTTVDSLSFVLIKAEEAGKESGAAPAAPKPQRGTKDAEQAEGKTYRLAAATIDTLNPHVGHKVEISGTMSPVGTSGAAGSSGGVAGVGVPPLVRVESVKMISSTCGR